VAALDAKLLFSRLWGSGGGKRGYIMIYTSAYMHRRLVCLLVLNPSGVASSGGAYKYKMGPYWAQDGPNMGAIWA
jgi:hypothetical protein